MKALIQARKDRLARYAKLQGDCERLQDELARRKNRQFLPAMPESDGSKRTPGASDRIANAVISRMTFEEKARVKLLKYYDEMSQIEDAILDLEDGLEQQVLLLRYITGTNDGTKLMPWKDVAMEIYGDDDDPQMQRVFRIHSKALQNINFGSGEALGDDSGEE